jgi:hypothetical protein
MQLQIIKEDIENFVAQKKAEIEEAKRERKHRDEKAWRICGSMCLTCFAAFGYCLFFRTSEINEKISIHNTPFFPLYNLSAYMNFNSTKENIDISCIIWLYSKNGNSTPSKLVKWFPFPENKNFTYSKSLLQYLGIEHLYLNKEDKLFIAVFCKEENYKRLGGKIFYLGYSTYLINSSYEIEEKYQYKNYYLDEELLLNSKIKEGKVYNYKIESNTLKKEDTIINFSSISEYDKLRFMPPELYGNFLFLIILEKGDLLKILEVEKPSFLWLFAQWFGSAAIIIKIVFYCCLK